MSTTTCNVLMAVGAAMLLTALALAWHQRSARRRTAAAADSQGHR